MHAEELATGDIATGDISLASYLTLEGSADRMARGRLFSGVFDMVFEP